MSEPTNEELAQATAKQIEQAQEKREAKDLERLERHGQAAAQLSEAIEAEQNGSNPYKLDASQKKTLDEINSQQSKSVEKELNRDNENGDLVKQEAIRLKAEQIREKFARDREQARELSR